VTEKGRERSGKGFATKNSGNKQIDSTSYHISGMRQNDFSSQQLETFVADGKEKIIPYFFKMN
jgi:hypothetical protein